MSPVTKPPTPQAISALLKRAGFERAVISIRGGNSGFQVTKCRAREDAVKVRQYFQVSVSSLERYREMLGKYARTIERAGYKTEVGTYHLVVTASPSPVILSEIEE